MSTIKEVAELAGVSVGTVSHVITGSHPVTEPLRLKVNAAIKKLNYHPNHIARSLKNRRTQTLGIVVPDLTISFFPQIIRGAEAAARASGYSVIVASSDEEGDRQRNLLNLLHSQRVDGVLLIPAAAPLPLVSSRTPIVYVDRIPDLTKADSVAAEDEHAAAMGVDHLITQGYRRIAIVTGPLTLKNERGRLNGYESALRRAGLPVTEELIWEGNLRMEDVAQLCARRLNGSGARPDAILSTNGPTGMGALRAFREIGLRTPRDIGFVTFDELVVEGIFEPAVTTIVQPAYQIGFRATEILLARIAEGTEHKEFVSVRLPAKLEVRESTRPPHLTTTSLRPIP